MLRLVGPHPIALVTILLVSCVPGLAAERPPVHAVSDLGHQFTFYADGRFHAQYLQGQPVAMNWGSLFNFDFSNANLLLLLGCDSHLQYVPQDIQTITNFLGQGGGVLLLGSARDAGQNGLARHFGCVFEQAAQSPLKAASSPITGELAGGGDTLSLRETNLWQVLITDAQEQPVLARRSFAKGTLLVGARGLAGQNPNASDNINASWWQPLLVEAAAGKKVDPAKPFKSRGITELEYSENLGQITLRYSDYLKPYAKAMADIYLRARPVIEQRMGVPLAQGMASEIGLLATGGGGFSSGQMLGLAVFWGDFPNREDSMIEFITHESVHSWVLPLPEIWNEPIATYVGNLVMLDMGYEAEARRRIERTIQRASRLDPTMKLYDLAGKGPAHARQLTPGEANDVHWGKTFWILEQLRQQNPQVLARYFQAKRRLVSPEKVKRYDADATVALLSLALNRDLFPWFREHGLEVDAARSPMALSLSAARHPAPAPLFRDPVHDGAADPTLVYNHQEKCWWMLYTNRRADADDEKGVKWVHGTDIGLASTPDQGATWVYRGIARGLEFESGRNTFWAPEVVDFGGKYHAFISYVRGVPETWKGSRDILHYTSTNLLDWNFETIVVPGSIDPCVHRLPNGKWRMWFKNEQHKIPGTTLDSDDLYTWKPTRAEMPDPDPGKGEGPDVMFWKGSFWMVKDLWKGLGVYRSADADQWEFKGIILDQPGQRPGDHKKGQHAGFLLLDADTCYLVYFVHQAEQEPAYRHTWLQAVQLGFDGKTLTCDRDAPFEFLLKPPTPEFTAENVPAVKKATF